MCPGGVLVMSGVSSVTNCDNRTSLDRSEIWGCIERGQHYFSIPVHARMSEAQFSDTGKQESRGDSGDGI